MKVVIQKLVQEEARLKFGSGQIRSDQVRSGQIRSGQVQEGWRVSVRQSGKVAKDGVLK